MEYNNMDLSAKTIVVTGAVQGIGKSIVYTCAKLGASVIVNYRNRKDEAQSLCREIISTYDVNAYPVCFDVTDGESIKQALSPLFSDGIEIEGWVNNAGINLPGLLLTQSPEMVKQQIETNIVGPINCCQAIIPHMMEHRRGVIVNVGSVTRHFVSQGQAVYAATKGALASLTRALAKEYGRKGIRVNCIEPGPVDTDMFKTSKILRGEQIRERVALGRIGEPGEIGDAVAYLLSDQASYITGSILTVDGGYTLG